MAPKKSYNKTSKEAKENVNWKTTDSTLSVGTPQPDEKTINDGKTDSLIDEADLNEKENEKLIFSDISNQNDGLYVSGEHAKTVQYDLINPRVNVGQKRHIEESSDLILNKNNIEDLTRLKKQCLEIEKRVEVLEKTWMPCPEHLDVVENIFNGILEDVNDNRVVMNDNNKMSDSNNGLNIEPEILSALKKNSSTATARSILRYLYPNPSVKFKLSDVDPSLVAGIVQYSEHCHPEDASTTIQIRRAMSNYFATITHREKRKSIISNTSTQN